MLLFLQLDLGSRADTQHRHALGAMRLSCVTVNRVTGTILLRQNVCTLACMWNSSDTPPDPNTRFNET